MDIVSLWDKTLQLIKGELSPPSFNAFFKQIIPLKIHMNELILLVPNDFTKGILEDRYLNLIESSINQLSLKKYKVKFVLDEKYVEGLEEEPKSSNIPQKNYPNLNPKYTFDTFVIGNSNRFAHAACVAVAESPARAYNPLFLYGGVGLGKTHLMHAIGHHIITQKKDAKVVYVSSEKFTNELINSIKDDRNEEFRNKYRNVDILLIDDIQFIAGKERTQEEFFHTFNTLHNAGKQIVLASDRPAKEIKSLEERLRTRFEWGLTADIQPPDFETRVAIVKRKAELLNLDLPDDVAEYIANHLKQNIRQLEGAVKKLNAYYMLEGIAPCIGVTTTAIKDTLNDTQPIPVTIEKIINEVARTYNVIPSDIRGKKRSANVSAARQMSMYIIREITGMSMEAIGSEFQRDHSTVVYSINTMEKNIGKDRHLKETVDDIMKNIRA